MFRSEGSSSGSFHIIRPSLFSLQGLTASNSSREDPASPAQAVDKFHARRRRSRPSVWYVLSKRTINWNCNLFHKTQPLPALTAAVPEDRSPCITRSRRPWWANLIPNSFARRNCFTIQGPSLPKAMGTIVRSTTSYCTDNWTTSPHPDCNTRLPHGLW
jgi:hypothetical protein